VPPLADSWGQSSIAICFGFVTGKDGGSAERRIGCLTRWTIKGRFERTINRDLP